MAAANVSHNDIKPANFLADWPQGESPDITNLTIYLTDFGMADRAGGTPVYCSPEGLTETTPGLSDMFSLGRVFTFLVMEDRSLFYTLVFTTILDSAHHKTIRNVMTSFPILNLIAGMTHVEQNKRLKIEGGLKKLFFINEDYNLEIITKVAIESELTALGQSGILNEDYQVEEMLNER